MSDYIKRDAVMERTVKRNSIWNKVTNASGQGLEEIINEIPSADVAPVRHGRWEVIDTEEPRRYGCSECKRLSWYMENYCGNCGARMDGDEDE